MSIFLFISAKYNGVITAKLFHRLKKNAGVPLQRGNKRVQNVEIFENNDYQLSC